MKNLLYQYAQYNLWAHQRLTTCILSLTFEQQHLEIQSSFNSLYKTVMHMWFSELAWWNRLHQLPAAKAGDPFNANMKEVSLTLLSLDEEFVKWVGSKDELSIAEQFSYHSFRGLPFTEPANVILMHVFNHSTYHNGQLVTLLHHAGAHTIPATDFIEWYRNRDVNS
jgi:uncharacterized damage-inducible protein DinB